MNLDDRIEVNGLHVAYETRHIDADAPWYEGLLKSTIVRKQVLKGLDFKANGQGISAILGHNGAGKTTFIKSLTGVLTPNAGKVSVLGFEPATRKREFLRKIGVVFGQKRALWPEMTLRENLFITAAVYGFPKNRIRRRTDEIIAEFALEQLADRPVKTYSLGETMKAEIANVLLYEPSLIFLDEPTIGLDLPAQIAIRQGIRNYVSTHAAHVVLTSHNLRDIAELSTSVWFIEEGVAKEFAVNDDNRVELEQRLERKLMSP